MKMSNWRFLLIYILLEMYSVVRSLNDVPVFAGSFRIPCVALFYSNWLCIAAQMQGMIVYQKNLFLRDIGMLR